MTNITIKPAKKKDAEILVGYFKETIGDKIEFLFTNIVAAYGINSMIKIVFNREKKFNYSPPYKVLETRIKIPYDFFSYTNIVVAKTDEKVIGMAYITTINEFMKIKQDKFLPKKRFKYINYLLDDLKTIEDLNNFQELEGIYIHSIFVEEAYRKQGVGEKLINAVIESTKNMDLSQIYTHVIANNENAIKFYKKKNFEEVIIEKEDEEDIKLALFNLKL